MTVRRPTVRRPTLRRPTVRRAAAVLLISTLVLPGCRRGGDDVTGPTTADQGSDIAAGLVLDANISLDPDDVARADLGAEQLGLLASSGSPDRFTIRFDGRTRVETWHYDGAGLTVAFRDGEALYRDDAEPLALDGLGSTPYAPDRFTAGMSVVELLAVTEQRGYAEQAVDLDADVTGRLIVVEGLVAAFDDSGLRYVETIPIDLS